MAVMALISLVAAAPTLQIRETVYIPEFSFGALFDVANILTGSKSMPFLRKSVIVYRKVSWYSTIKVVSV